MTHMNIGTYQLVAARSLRLLRHVILPATIAEQLPRNRLLTETEWRNLGVQQSR